VPPAVLHLLPFENSKNGIVLETLDLLLGHSHSPDDATKGGNGRVVVEELRTKVQHCLVVLEGEEGGESGLEGVEWVASHVQVRSFHSFLLPMQVRRTC
jgi:prephenate dehydratase